MFLGETATPGPRSVDLNADLGESFGPYTLGHDEALLRLVSSANVACGFHAGDPATMARTVALAVRHGVAIGAHPGYPDRVGFGRRDLDAGPSEIRNDLIYQIGALAAFCAAAGTRLQHVKPHGALYNRACRDAAVARAVAEAAQAVSHSLLIYALPASQLARAAGEVGLSVVLEGFADRAYEADGTLTPRGRPNAEVADPDEAAERALTMVQDGQLRARDGSLLHFRPGTICLHGDNPQAVTFAQRLRARLEQAGVAVRAPQAEWPESPESPQ